MQRQLKKIQPRLMAALSMLLVSAVMLASTSYAWFVLSTAPEAADLTTVAGANGALEIALQSTNADGNGRAEITHKVGDSIKPVDQSNTTWGNLVDLTTGYGLEHITLFPSRLHVTGTTVDGATSYSVNTNSILAAPLFGTDGRVVRLNPASKTHYSADGSFTDTANWGVNVIGFAQSGDMAEDNSFTRAYSRANVLAEATQKVGTYRMELRAEMEDLIERNSYGIFGVMAALVGVNLMTNEQLTATVTDYVASMEAMIGDAADAVRWALLANAVADSTYSSDSDEDMRALGTIYKEFLQYPMISEDPNAVTVFSIATGKYPEIATAAAAVATAQTRIGRASRDIAQGSIASAALMLVNPNESFMYGMNAASGVADQSITNGLAYDFLMGVQRDTIFMVKTEGADSMSVNLFSSLAAVLGDYGATMTVWLQPTGENTFNMVDQEPTDGGVWMECNYDIKATNKSSYAGWSDVTNLDLTAADDNIGVLGKVYLQVSGITATGDILMPVTRSDITAYGYSIDLAFQASESTSLMLQQTGTERIFDNDKEDLQGVGSTLTFTIPGDLSHEQTARLLQCIHIVFMNTTTGTIYKIAAADPGSIETVLDAATATLQLYEPGFAEDGSLSLGSRVSDNVITDMTKDTPYYITAVIYLNGDLVDSGMFSPGQTLSLDGRINLQFSSQTQLQSMKYSNFYHTEDNNEGN